MWGALRAGGLGSVPSGRDRVGVEEVTHHGKGHMKKNRSERQENERSERAQSGVREIPGSEIDTSTWDAGERSSCGGTDQRTWSENVVREVMGVSGAVQGERAE